MRGLRTVIRPSIGAATVFAIAFCISLAPTLSLLRQPYTVWAEFDSVWGTIPALLFPGVAGLSAAAAVRRGSGGSMLMLPAGRVPVFIRMAVLQIPLAIAAIAGVTVGVSPVLLKTVRTATEGSPQLASFALFLGHFLLIVVASTVLAVTVRSFVAVPLAIVVSFIWTQAANYFGENFSTVSAYRPYPQVPGLSLSHSVVAGSALFILVVFALLSVAFWALTASPPKWAAAGTSFVLIVAFVAVVSIVSGKSDLALWAVDSDAPRECGDSARVSVCVHQAHSRDLDQVFDYAEAVLENYGDSLPRPPVLIDRSLLMAPRDLAPEVVIIQLSPGETDTIRLQLAQRLSGYWACANSPDPSGIESSARLQKWLVDGPDSQDADHTRQMMWDYIKSNQLEISECRVDPATLPIP